MELGQIDMGQMTCCENALLITNKDGRFTRMTLLNVFPLVYNVGIWGETKTVGN